VGLAEQPRLTPLRVCAEAKAKESKQTRSSCNNDDDDDDDDDTNNVES
jgi:hypothetical protein